MDMGIATATKMSRQLIYGKGVLLSLFLLLFSCSPKCPEWQYQETITSTPCFNSGRIFLSPSNPFRQLEIEIDRNRHGSEMYLNVLTFNFPHDSAAPVHSSVEVQIDKEYFECQTDLLLGAQRMKLPKSLSEKITTALLNKQTVIIRSGRFESVILETGFSKAFQKLHKIPIASSRI
ncbi:hypothetical protein [Parachlamydia sp. AcF125]|uniref:hypothetical protein n=1 Tax=Parachlamydia sp. AcF125 TaxID=2795736 RepID=UPI001BD8B141|nr:hypothetical protein [Parachlamydia sp. AcF125]MBS4167497.1 hypothetical protein [Parachlamydia sp. AcF125]